MFKFKKGNRGCRAMCVCVCGKGLGGGGGGLLASVKTDG